MQRLRPLARGPRVNTAPWVPGLRYGCRPCGVTWKGADSRQVCWMCGKLSGRVVAGVSKEFTNPVCGQTYAPRTPGVDDGGARVSAPYFVDREYRETWDDPADVETLVREACR